MIICTGLFECKSRNSHRFILFVVVQTGIPLSSVACIYTNPVGSPLCTVWIRSNRVMVVRINRCKFDLLEMQPSNLCDYALPHWEHCFQGEISSFCVTDGTKKTYSEGVRLMEKCFVWGEGRTVVSFLTLINQKQIRGRKEDKVTT